MGLPGHGRELQGNASRIGHGHGLQGGLVLGNGLAHGKPARITKCGELIVGQGQQVHCLLGVLRQHQRSLSVAQQEANLQQALEIDDLGRRWGCSLPGLTGRQGFILVFEPCNIVAGLLSQLAQGALPVLHAAQLAVDLFGEAIQSLGKLLVLGRAFVES